MALSPKSFPRKRKSTRSVVLEIFHRGPDPRSSIAVEDKFREDDPSGQFGIVVSRFNREITDQLLRGAAAALRAHGVSPQKIRVVQVPGAFELPVAALRLARSKRYAAVIAIGCIVAGQTPQYEFLSQATYQGLMLAGVLTGVPVTCAVITATRWSHAVRRASPKGLNRGGEAAEAAWEMVRVPSGIPRSRAGLKYKQRKE